MAGNLLEFVATKNKKLVEFFDQNANAAKLLMKLVRVLGDIASENHVSSEEMRFEVYGPKGSNVIVVKITHPTKSITV